MITAKRTTDQRRITRNSSHKKFNAGSQYSQDQVPWDFEKEDEGNDSLSKTEKTPTYLSDPKQLNLDDGRRLIHSQPLDQQPTTCQSGRA